MICRVNQWTSFYMIDTCHENVKTIQDKTPQNFGFSLHERALKSNRNTSFQVQQERRV